jgi:TonB C terminal
MENEKDNKYFIIWLYISILLHLFVVIIMLTIKTATSSSADPDPASFNNNSTQIIFVQDEPTIPDEPQPLPQIAARMQGGQVASMQQNRIEPKDAQQDIPTPALSDEYKKGMHNQTKIENQDPDGHINILEDAIIASEEQREKQILPQAQAASQVSLTENMLATAADDMKTTTQSNEATIKTSDILKTIIADFSTQKIDQQEKSNTNIDQKENIQREVQKIVSNKHRPADIGLENVSKVQLSKQPEKIESKKNKLSLLDLQSGFNQFVKNSSTKQIATPTSSVFGNSLYFSSTGNAQKDDELGLKLTSYMNQTGKMYDNACSIYYDIFIKALRQQGLPYKNNSVIIKIERSGKISEIKMIESCGNEIIDNYHVQIIESIGYFPPIPKYIEAPLSVGARFTFSR